MTSVFRIGFKPLCALGACAVLAAGIASSARAELLVYEGFDYTAGSGLSGLTGGFGWDLQPGDPNVGSDVPGWDSLQADIGSDTIQAGSLSYIDALGNTLETLGGHLLNTGEGGTSQGGRFLAERRDSGTTWLSFLAQRTGGQSPEGTFTRGANAALFDMFNTSGVNIEKLNIGPHNSNVVWTNPDTQALESLFQLRYPSMNNVLEENLPAGSEPPTPNTLNMRIRDAFTEAPSGDVNLFLMRIDHLGDEMEGDNVYVWMNPTLGVEPSLEDVSARYIHADVVAAAATQGIDPYAAGNFGDQAFNRFRFFAGNADANGHAEVLFDEIRIGTTFDAVTPFIPGGGGDCIDGDFNCGGAVENADLTLLLNNWGAAVPPTPAGWIGNPPTAPAIDNDELTLLLNNWGNVATPPGSGSAVPEPTSLLLALVGLVGMLVGRRRSV